MKLSQIIAFAREQFLDDAEQPFLFSDPNLAQAATVAQEEACGRCDLLYDDTTQTDNNLFSGTTDGAATSKLIDSTATFTSTAVGKTVYNMTDKTFATVTALDSPTQLSLSGDIMASGESYVIGDASAALCLVPIVSGTGSYSLSRKITKIQTAILWSGTKPLEQKTEAWLDQYIYNWRKATGTPAYYVERPGSIRLVPAPDDTLNANTGRDLLSLTVHRLPLLDLSLDTDLEPEIPSEYHYGLIHWMCALMFQKPDTETQDLVKAQWHERKFAERFGERIAAHDRELFRALGDDFTLSQPSMNLGQTMNQ